MMLNIVQPWQLWLEDQAVVEAEAGVVKKNLRAENEPSKGD
jgi:hypothetical protein